MQAEPREHQELCRYRQRLSGLGYTSIGAQRGTAPGSRTGVSPARASSATRMAVR